MKIAIVCSDPFHEGARRVLHEFEPDALAAIAGVHDWSEISIRRRGGTYLGPRNGTSTTKLGVDDFPVPIEAYVPADEDARFLERWPDPVRREVHEFTCKECGAQQRARHENLCGVLDALAGAGLAEISVQAIPEAIHRLRLARSGSDS